MSVRESLKRFFLYDGLSKEDYKSIEVELHESNRRSLLVYSIFMVCLFGSLCIAGLLIESIRVNLLPYSFGFIGAAVLAVVLGTSANRKLSVTIACNYVFATLILGFCAFIGTITAPEQVATSMCVALAIVPFVSYDIGLRSLIHRLLMCGIFVILDVRTKEFLYVSRDLINIVCYLLVGTIVGGFAKKAQASALYLKRNMNKEIRKQTQKVESLSLQSMEAIAAAIDAKDRYTNGHSLRVAKYSRMIAERMGKSELEVSSIYYIAMLHDVGKIGIPDGIINNTSTLTEAEYNVIKSHPTMGYAILKNIDELPGIALGAKYHHEWYNGSGYPSGLSGNDIPEIGRIIAVADAYDAMTSNRSYRTILDQKKVRSEIENGKGSQFDPAIAEIMLKIMDEDKGYNLHE